MANSTIGTAAKTIYIDNQGKKRSGITAPTGGGLIPNKQTVTKPTQADALYTERSMKPTVSTPAPQTGDTLYAERTAQPIVGTQSPQPAGTGTIQSVTPAQEPAAGVTKPQTSGTDAVQGTTSAQEPTVGTPSPQPTGAETIQSTAQTREPITGYEGWRQTHPEAEARNQADKNAQILTLEDDLKNVDTLLEQAKADNDRIYQMQLEQTKARIERQIESINAQYAGLNRQLYVDYMNRRRDLPQQLAARGYTGGLRESSMLGLETGYESNLAENERKRMEGIRELEAGGNDQALTLGIENARANKEAADTAYSRAAQIRDQIRAQQDRIDAIKREEAATTRQEAQAQIARYLEAGAGLQDIPPEVLMLSGYDPSFIEQQAAAAQKKIAQQRIDAMLAAGASPKTIPAELIASAGYDTAYLDAMAIPAKSYAQKMVESYLAAGADISQIPAELLELSGYDTSYIDTLTSSRTKQQAQSQVAALLSAGVDISQIPAELIAAAGYDTAYRDALTTTQGRQHAQTEIDSLLAAGYELYDVPETLLRKAGYSDDTINSLRKRRSGSTSKEGKYYGADGSVYGGYGGGTGGGSGSGGGYSRTDDGTVGGYLIPGAPYGGGAVDTDALREMYLQQDPDYYYPYFYQNAQQAQQRIDEMLVRGTDVSEIPQYLIDTAGYTPKTPGYTPKTPTPTAPTQPLTAQNYGLAGMLQSYVQSGIMSPEQASQTLQTDLGTRVNNGELSQDEAIAIMDAWHI